MHVNEEKGTVDEIDRAVLSYDSANSGWLSTFDRWRERLCALKRACHVEAAADMVFRC